MKILFLNPDKRHSCSFYRSAGVTKDLRNQTGYDIVVKSWPEIEFDWQGVVDYDLIMMQRPYTADMLIFCQKVKEMDIPLWLDYDDDYFSLTAENRAWQVFNNPKVQIQIKKMLKLADVVSVTTDDLKQAYSKYNDNIHVIPNAFNDSIFKVDRKLPKRKKIVLWRGSDTHIHDVLSHAKPINDITKEFPEYKFSYVGYQPWFLQPGKNTEFIAAMNIIDYFHDIYKRAPSVVQIPLHDTLFNRAKSNIAFIEGSYWGAVCLIPEWWGEIPGTISYTDEESYYKALKFILEGEIDIVKENKIAWDYIKENLLLSKVNKLRVNLMKELLNG